jgi:hypothetical protein
MDPLITINDFSNPMLVYAKTSGATDTYFDEVVQRYQKKILLDILGRQLYNEFDVAYKAGLTDDFWNRFYNGYDYTVDSVEYKYLGIKEVLVGFIFYYWMASKKSTLAEDGHTIADYQESSKYLPQELMEESWNDAVDVVNSNDLYAPTVYHFIDNNYDGDGSWIFTEIDKISMWI